MPRAKSTETGEVIEGAIRKNLPKEEDGPTVTCYTKSRRVYVISQNRAKKRFTLWEGLPNGYKKIETAKLPGPLREVIPWQE